MLDRSIHVSMESQAAIPSPVTEGIIFNTSRSLVSQRQAGKTSKDVLMSTVVKALEFGLVGLGRR